MFLWMACSALCIPLTSLRVCLTKNEQMQVTSYFLKDAPKFLSIPSYLVFVFFCKTFSASFIIPWGFLSQVSLPMPSAASYPSLLLHLHQKKGFQGILLETTEPSRSSAFLQHKEKDKCSSGSPGLRDASSFEPFVEQRCSWASVQAMLSWGVCGQCYWGRETSTRSLKGKVTPFP